MNAPASITITPVFVADLSVEGRAQVWGVTFPYEQTRNSEAAATFPNELDALVARLNERVFERVEGERDRTVATHPNTCA